MSPLIGAAELRDLITSTPTVRILDVRWQLAQPDGREAYAAGHIPGAVYVDLNTQLATPGEPATEGRHPLPTLEALQQAARDSGISAGETVIIYDDAGSAAASRAWWLLRWAGLTDVRVLDGGLSAWTAAELELDTGWVDAAPGDITFSHTADGSGHMPVLEHEQVAEFARSGLLLDARGAERYRGDVEPMDPRAGHIPGAHSLPTSEVVDGQGRFLEPAEIRRRLSSLGSEERPTAAYCGSGVTASQVVLAAELAGVRAALYPGSFSQWSNHPEFPVATGNQPG